MLKDGLFSVCIMYVHRNGDTSDRRRIGHPVPESFLQGTGVVVGEWRLPRDQRSERKQKIPHTDFEVNIDTRATPLRLPFALGSVRRNSCYKSISEESPNCAT